ELQRDPALLARLALLTHARRLVRRGFEARVATPASAAAGCDDTLAFVGEVGEQLARLGIADRRARRHLDLQVVARCAETVEVAAGGSLPRPEVDTLLEGRKGVQARVDDEHDIAPAAPITARRAAPRDVLLAPKRHGSRAAIPALDVDLRYVQKHSEPRIPNKQAPRYLRAAWRSVCVIPTLVVPLFDHRDDVAQVIHCLALWQTIQRGMRLNSQRLGHLTAFLDRAAGNQTPLHRQ